VFPLFKRQGPQEVRRSFARNQLRDYGQPPIETAKKRKSPRQHVSTNQWPHGRLNYGFLIGVRRSSVEFLTNSGHEA